MIRHYTTHFLAALALLIVSNAAAATELSADEQRMMAWIDANTEASIDLLEETVNISSGTLNHEGVRKLGDVMARELEAMGFEAEWIDMPDEMQRAGHLFGRRYVDGKSVCL